MYNIVEMNVYVVGSPTTGKSSLAKILKKKIPQLNVISFEAVRNGFMKAQPELDMGNRQSLARKEILPQFVLEFAVWNERMTGQPTLVEGSFAMVREIADKVRKEDIIVCLGYGKMTLAEIARRAISKAGADSYLFGRTEEEFMDHFYDLVDDDRMNREFCKENEIPYFVTADERGRVLDEVAESIIKRIVGSK